MRYEIIDRLGEGGMSEILLAVRRGIGGFQKVVALKRVKRGAGEDFEPFLIDEARVAATFTHQGIAQVYDLDASDDGDELFIAMEFVPGATLEELVAKGPLPIGFSLAAVRDTALALDYAHHRRDYAGNALGVIHRDVAPKNVMATFEGATKLLDFGIARLAGQRQRTRIGLVRGTVGYMSPEQATGERLDARSDIFALGIVLHEMLTGRTLFVNSVLVPVVAPSKLNRSVPSALDAVVLKALARTRHDRFATARDFARAIEHAMPGELWDEEARGELVRARFASRRRRLVEALSRMTADAPTRKFAAQRRPDPRSPRPADDPSETLLAP